MNEELTDITPNHSPIGLAKDMLNIVSKGKFVAGLWVLIDEDGKLKFDGCGNMNQEVLWALEKMKFSLMMKVYQDE